MAKLKQFEPSHGIDNGRHFVPSLDYVADDITRAHQQALYCNLDRLCHDPAALPQRPRIDAAKGMREIQ
jgi:hypothetical protein